MQYITNLLVRMGILRDDLDYHLIRASMVIIYLFLGIRNGSNMKRRLWFRTSVSVR
jgi:hypothetical protein